MSCRFVEVDRQFDTIIEVRKYECLKKISLMYIRFKKVHSCSAKRERALYELYTSSNFGKYSSKPSRDLKERFSL